MSERPELDKLADNFADLHAYDWEDNGEHDELGGWIRAVLTPDTILRLARECLTHEEKYALTHRIITDGEYAVEACVGKDVKLHNLRILAGEEERDL